MAKDGHDSSATPGKEFNAAHILVETEEEAKALKAELDGGADFATLAKEKSVGPSGPNGGDLGWFGVGMMVKPFEDAVVGLEPGQVSDPVQTQFGWHVIKLNETRDAAAPSLDEKREELEGELRSAAVESHVRELTEGAEIVKMVDGIDPAILNTTPEIVIKYTNMLLDQIAPYEGHIINLGHGILPQAKIENVQAMIDTVRTYKK